MPPDLQRLDALIEELKPFGATLVAVSKTRSSSEIGQVREHGHRDFGENYVRELVEKSTALPHDIRWHYIGHLQSNKARQVVPVASLIHGVDSLKLLVEIGRQSARTGKIQDVLLQVHIASEETKFGFDEQGLMEAMTVLQLNPVSGIRIRGLMGMASFTEDSAQVRTEFRLLRRLFESIRRHAAAESGFDTLSMGMSGDYRIALEEGSTLVRIGTAIFGAR